MSKSLPVAIADPEEYVAIFIAGNQAFFGPNPFSAVNANQCRYCTDLHLP